MICHWGVREREKECVSVCEKEKVDTVPNQTSSWQAYTPSVELCAQWLAWLLCTSVADPYWRAGHLYGSQRGREGGKEGGME